MKIDHSKDILGRNLVFNNKDTDNRVFSNFEKLSIKSNSPVWKNEVINDSQMDAQPSEEFQILNEAQIEEREKSQNEPQQNHTQVERQENHAQNDRQENGDQPKGDEKPAADTEDKLESQEKSVQKQEEETEPAVQPLTQTQLEHKPRIVVKHSILGNKIPSHDPNVLVESTTFTSIGKIQPFLITVSTNAALVMDYHSHLTTSEVCGYLAGNWDLNSHTLNVTDAFPCKCRLGDYESAPAVESEIRKTIKSNGLTLVGWYHSHPTAPATPSIRDVETQLDYQLRMKGSNDSTYLPCIGVICSPYNPDNPTFESILVCYWVVPPPENKIHEYGKPMMMSYSVYQDQAISYDVLLEMKKCADFYKPEKDYINFSEMIKEPVTFLEKLKTSLTPKFPLNHQKSELFWNYIQDITLASDKPETEILKQVIEISNTPSATPPPSEKPKFNIPNIPTIPHSLPPINFKSTANSAPCGTGTLPYNKPHSRSKSSSSSAKRSSSRDSKNLSSLNNYFVGSDLAALFGTGKFPGMAGLDPATKSLLNLNSLSLGGMFLPPMAAAAAAAAAYKPDPAVGLMKPPPPPSSSYYSYPSRNSSNSRSSSGSSRSQNRNIPSTSRDMPPPNKVPKLDVHQMANFFVPPNLGKNCTVTSRPSTSTSSK